MTALQSYLLEENDPLSTIEYENFISAEDDAGISKQTFYIWGILCDYPKIFSEKEDTSIEEPDAFTDVGSDPRSYFIHWKSPVSREKRIFNEFSFLQNSEEELSDTEADSSCILIAAAKKLPSREELAKWKRYSILFDSLNDLYNEYSASGWDGYDAEPISPKAYSDAIQLISILPDGLPLPEVIPEPSGEIAFEWYAGKYSVFVISVWGENTMNFAGLFDKKSKIFGTERLGYSFPKSLAENISRVISTEV